MGLRSFFSEIILYFWCVILEPGLLCQMKRVLMHTGSWKQSFTCFFLQYRFLCIHVFNHPLIMFYHVKCPWMQCACCLIFHGSQCQNKQFHLLTWTERILEHPDITHRNIGIVICPTFWKSKNILAWGYSDLWLSLDIMCFLSCEWCVRIICNCMWSLPVWT